MVETNSNRDVCNAMADLSPHMQPYNVKPLSRRILPWVFALIALALLGGAVLWSNPRDGAAPSADITQRASELTGQQQDQTAKQLAGLQQTVNDLRMTQQRLQEQLAAFQGKTAEIDDLKRQVSAERGDRKLLSDQLGALSARVDSLVLPSAEPPASPAAAAKKKRGAR